jgi:DNA-binding beta-propeller fold protein YncE
VGVQPDGRVVVPTNQVLKPAGKQVTFPGRPIDLAFADDGKTLVVKNLKNLVFLDLAAAKVKQTLDVPDDPPVPFNPVAAMAKPIAPDGKGHHYPTGFSVTGLLVLSERVYVTDSQGLVRVALRGQDGSYHWGNSIALIPPRVGGSPYGAGLARLSAEELWVAASRGNSVQLLNLTTGQAEQAVTAGVAPYAVAPTSATGAATRRRRASRKRYRRARRCASTRRPASPTRARSPSWLPCRASGSRSRRSPSACTPAA